MTVALGLGLTAGLSFASSGNGVVGGGQVADTPADLDINAYCAHTNQGPDSSIITGTQDWACSNNGTGSKLNLNQVCLLQHPGFSDAKEIRSGDPLSYQCFK